MKLFISNLPKRAQVHIYDLSDGIFELLYEASSFYTNIPSKSLNLPLHEFSNSSLCIEISLQKASLSISSSPSATVGGFSPQFKRNPQNYRRNYPNKYIIEQDSNYENYFKPIQDDIKLI